MQESIYPSSNRTAWKDTAEEQVLSIKEKFVIISNTATKRYVYGFTTEKCPNPYTNSTYGLILKIFQFLCTKVLTSDSGWEQGF